MIPFRDNIPSRTFPFITVSLIIINSIVFLHELTLGRQLNAFLFNYALIPARLADSFGQMDVLGLLPLMTSMFLHAGWLHLIGNMWFLWIFGDNVEDYLGHFTYLLFYIFCGLAGNLSQVALNWSSGIPCLGASGAIAGVLGAYLLLYPGARVLTLIPLFIFWPIVEIPAFILLGFWFVEQFFYGVATSAAASGGGIAWMVHVAGFISGMILISLVKQSHRRHSMTW
ncbi:MAG: rhomboid family intramembrane serine protease [Acidobacteriia bacterium]|nr:rhomboid family intramembrane serine protease [Terriglobia bacterium]